MTRPRAIALFVAAVASALATTWAPASTAGSQPAGAGRVLVVALPGLTWAEVRDHDLPNLESFFADAALAGMAPRSVLFNSRPGDAYLTISAGTRARTDPLQDGQQLAVDERFVGSSAADVYGRRTSNPIPTAGHVALGWPTLDRINRGEPYDAVLGLLGATLADAGVRTAVIANADGTDGSGPSFERQAALAFTMPDGTLPRGYLARDLSSSDPVRPFGTRTNAERVLEVFSDEWHGTGGQRAVVLVEASDLARAIRYRTLVDADRYQAIRATALREADQLVGGLLREVDPARDTVLVISPYHGPSRAQLTVSALRTPGSRPGYLRSASTQREGVVTLVDVAPTLLDTVGLTRPVEMEGRPFEVLASGAGLTTRVERLASLNEVSLFRTNLLYPTTLAAVLMLTAVAALTAVTIGGNRPDRYRHAVGVLALVNLAVFPVSYLARAFPLERLGVGFYWAFLAVAAVALGAGAWAAAVRARQPALALIVVLGAVLAIPVLDVVTGSRLHLGAAFGYSPTGNSRLYGVSNYTFGQIAVAAVILAALVAWRWPGRRGRGLAIAIPAGLLVVLGMPVWGANVGGLLTFTPTVLLFAALLFNYRFRLWHVVGAGLATATAVVVFGFVDLARPPDRRAHLGRLFERIGDEGLGPLFTIAGRKLDAVLDASAGSFWVAAIPVAVGLWLFLRLWRTRPLAAVRLRVPTLQAALAASVFAAVVGSVANDSGAIVAGVAGLVVAASLAYLATVPSEPVP